MGSRPRHGLFEVVKLLATCGADLTLADEAKATPYDWALQGLSFLSERYERLVGALFPLVPALFRSEIPDFRGDSGLRTYEAILDFLMKKGAKVQGELLGPLERCPYPSSRGPAS